MVSHIRVSCAGRVQGVGDRLKILGAVDRQVCALGHVLLQEAVLVSRSIHAPRTVRVTEVDLNAVSIVNSLWQASLVP